MAASRDVFVSRITSNREPCKIFLQNFVHTSAREYVYFESSYDRFHKDSDRVYRVYMERIVPSRHVLTATIHPGISPAMKAEFPEVEEYARMLPQGIRMPKIVTMSHVDKEGNEKVFYEENIYTVDPSFFKVLSFPLLYGHPAEVLKEAHSIVLSESTAKKCQPDCSARHLLSGTALAEHLCFPHRHWLADVRRTTSHVADDFNFHSGRSYSEKGAIESGECLAGRIGNHLISI